ncbi:MAG TPA: TMEM175 family protein [Allosphingosinicella sp.]|jgi:uncharacterized membrane protein|nr:TMEM175 family protein [Allosphingosinicella sp.]
MSEPESLSTVEGLDEHVRRHSYDRLIMLSDGIFAIATTLAALDVRLPAQAASLGTMLYDSRRSLAAYGLSFFVAGIFWVSNRNLFARLRRVDGPLTFMTLAMLCMIALIPATIRSLYLESGGDARFRVYGLTMFICGLLNSAMWWYAAFRPGLMMPSISRHDRIVRSATTMTLPILFLPVLLMPADRFASVMLPLVAVTLIVRRVLLPKWQKSRGLR